MSFNYTERETGGYTLGEIEVKGEKVIISIQITRGMRLCIGDHVVSNGRYYRNGARGRIMRIREPNTNGATSNVIVVAWESDFSDVYINMKFEDLLFEPRPTNTRMENPVKT